MKLQEFPEHIQSLIGGLLDRGVEIWLVGSRANPTHRLPSDWDFLVFGNAEIERELSALPPPEDADILVVTNGENFKCPWPRLADGMIKQGDLLRWKWKRISDMTAHYEGTKLPDDWGSLKKAILIER